MNQKCDLSDVLSCCKLVQFEGNVGRVTPSDNGDSSAIWSDIQLLDNVNDELCDVMPAFWMHGPGRVQYEHQVYHPATFYSFSNIINLCTKVKIIVKTVAIALLTYDQQRFTIAELAADWQRMGSACGNKQALGTERNTVEMCASDIQHSHICTHRLIYKPGMLRDRKLNTYLNAVSGFPMILTLVNICSKFH